MSRERRYAWTAAVLTAAVAVGWVILLTTPAGHTVGNPRSGYSPTNFIDRQVAWDLQHDGYTCWCLDRNGNDIMDSDDWYTGCNPPRLIHRSVAVKAMIGVGIVLFAFAGTFARLARRGNPWAGFALGGLLGAIGVLAAVVVPVVPSHRAGTQDS